MNLEELVSVLHLKNKKKGVVYLKIKASEEESSVFTIRANLILWKKKVERAKAGGNGIIDYQMMDPKTALI